MEKNEIYKSLKIGSKSKEFCETCVLNKSTNEVTNKEPREVSNTKMDLIFSDICGPFPESFHGMKYIISFIDDYTKFAKVYFMASNSQASEKLEEFFVFCKEDKPKEIRSDNALEYKSKSFKDLCIKDGISQSFSAPYSTNQLGVAERYWRTLANMARTFINSSELDENIWVRAFDTANHICNRVSSKSTPGELSPFEFFYCRKPNLGYMKTFGCKACFKVQTHQRKLQPRAKLGVFCGYDESSRGYIIFNPETGTFISTRHVKFNEKQFVSSEPVENSDWPIPSFTETEVSETEVEATSEIEMVSPDISQSIEPQSPSENTVLEQSDLRRSQREKFAPKRYGDPVALPENIEIALNCSNASDPKTYEEALASSNASHWLDAMAKELKSLDEQKVWELVERPASSPVIKGKWVFTTKKGTRW